MTVIDVAIVGVGKIARDQHIPAIAGSGAFRLAATVSRTGVAGTPNFDTVEALLAARPDIPAISFCTPPQVRYRGARAALEAGRHVMLEKPPGASLSEVHALEALAATKGVALQATWHSRHAASVAAAKAWLAGREVRAVRIDWKEDVRVWHPGQRWIWEAGGLGVFDPAINAFSILTEILPVPVHVTAAELHFPENCDTPIAGEVRMAGPAGERVVADLDFLYEGDPLWRQVIETDAGTLTLDQGGAIMTVGGTQQGEAWHTPGITGEYPALYARFAELIAAGARDVDLRPMVLVADAFTLGRRLSAPAFVDPASAR
ncbi:Gfo/Idh/MocA family protein [Acuticoccus sp. I52.16.1]|uniref:Gfo/Idh/MocA family protein n=1 Tax=Acuticoccus sp. I52.16.1 TaxID=2928472 RepID=UPI001FD4468C|nr:Gfo/Idh/MocA family oxidoreductase [Acuticoccus sp. I52.16.1]UOM36222.1 Gfo/Idh/MocA family oxidoreductase [Acuticoccus sp. I52.16.1]